MAAGICADARERRNRTTGMLVCTASFEHGGERFEASRTLVHVEHSAAAARPMDFEPADRKDRLTHERLLGLLERAKRSTQRADEVEESDWLTPPKKRPVPARKLWGVEEAAELW